MSNTETTPSQPQSVEVYITDWKGELILDANGCPQKTTITDGGKVTFPGNEKTYTTEVKQEGEKTVVILKQEGGSLYSTWVVGAQGCVEEARVDNKVYKWENKISSDGKLLERSRNEDNYEEIYTFDEMGRLSKKTKEDKQNAKKDITEYDREKNVEICQKYEDNKLSKTQERNIGSGEVLSEVNYHGGRIASTFVNGNGWDFENDAEADLNTKIAESEERIKNMPSDLADEGKKDFERKEFFRQVALEEVYNVVCDGKLPVPGEDQELLNNYFQENPNYQTEYEEAQKQARKDCHAFLKEKLEHAGTNAEKLVYQEKIQALETKYPELNPTPEQQPENASSEPTQENQESPEQQPEKSSSEPTQEDALKQMLDAPIFKLIAWIVSLLKSDAEQRAQANVAQIVGEHAEKPLTPEEKKAQEAAQRKEQNRARAQEKREEREKRAKNRKNKIPSRVPGRYRTIRRGSSR